MAEVLTAEAVRDELAALTQWSGDPTGISRTVALGSFAAAIAVVVRVAEVAEQRDHHPDIDIRWRAVTFRCTTHSAGGVTSRDIELARQIDAIIRGAR